MLDLGLIEPPLRPFVPRTTIRDGERPVRLALMVVATSILLDALLRLKFGQAPVAGGLLLAKSVVLAVSLAILGGFARLPGAEARVHLLAVVIPGVTILFWGFQSIIALGYLALLVAAALFH
jgi:hypothetical protein